jgi:tRNA pseudouridine55 synthase
MNKVLNIYKPIGKTPLEMVHLVKASFPEYKDAPIGYAGRLDPLAHGVLLLMVGDATKERDMYLDMNKEYRFEAVFGIETDTYDVLGLLKRNIYRAPPENVNTFVNLFVTNHTKKLLQSYPPFSSKTVQGKPLFWWAKQQKLHEITIPEREIEIYSFAVQSFGIISAETF